MEIDLEVIECAACYMSFALPKKFLSDRRKDHQTFYCPMKHSNYFPGKTDEEVLKEKIKLKDQQLEEKSKLLAEAAAAAQRLRDERKRVVSAFLKEQFKKNSKGILLKAIAPQLGMKTGEMFVFLSTSASGIELFRSGKGWMVSEKTINKKGEK